MVVFQFNCRKGEKKRYLGDSITGDVCLLEVIRCLTPNRNCRLQNALTASSVHTIAQVARVPAARPFRGTLPSIEATTIITTLTMSDNDDDLFGGDSDGGDTDDLIAEANKKPAVVKKKPKRLQKKATTSNTKTNNRKNIPGKLHDITNLEFVICRKNSLTHSLFHSLYK